MYESPPQKNLESSTTLPPLMPLRRFVVAVSGEADSGDEQAIKKAIRRYHNRLANGSIPRSIFRKIGRELFVDIRGFHYWINLQPNSTGDRESSNY